MSLLTKFILHLDQFGIQPKKDKLLLAVSGGIDSIVLGELCLLAGFDFDVAHCNFKLRKEESDRDEQFVRATAQRWNKQIFVESFDTVLYTADHKCTVQVAARELRYKWFYELIDQSEATPQRLAFIVTAHHADDNIETVLMNFFKGTGIAGMRGIETLHDKLLRPLLPFRKNDLLTFATEHSLQWIEDSSNSSDTYSRNYVRNQLMPVVRSLYPEAEQNVVETIGRLKEAESLYQQSINFHYKRLVEKRGTEFQIPVLKLQKSEPLTSIVYEIAKKFNFSPQQIPFIIQLLEAETGRYVESISHRVIKNRKWLIIASKEKTDDAVQIIDQGQELVSTKNFQLRLSQKALDGFTFDKSKNVAQLDAAQLKYPLILRKWKQGDYFYPLGMKKKKKLARFFIDSKMSATEKEKVWVIESDNRIAWVIGQRIDDRFKVNEHTKKMLSITCQHE